MNDVLDRIRGGLVVSCQAPPGDPLHGPAFMTAMAEAAAASGAVGIRANGVDDVRSIRAATELPLIGLWKDGTEGVYITPTARHALAVAEAGADVVAADATLRPRPDGRTFADTVRAVHDAGALVMADVATVEDGVAAAAAGADVVGTTLSGYAGGSAGGPTPGGAASGGSAGGADGPDLALVASLAARLDVPVIAEGRVRTPDEAAQALAAGAWAVVVGTAITAPGAITARFSAALRR